ncbi:MBL fold metallo-hydrolase [Sporosarcina sp. HYO08]|uniref:YtnP family quorum-quenching lactonase n=1 Tax=Sporosarcina sp. HYO08 TaxID=1759557 RepID=UPI000797F667|nr:MBL fold metallo-hydrolase [Sporosarcina sp. HYO08]KXH87151.1 hypothetical protein AU377_00830 [Sporosarcina sp. HYO08]
MDQYTFHDMQLTWLDGGLNYLDGGTMFGVVPKVLWSKRYETNEHNQIRLRNDPILIQYRGKNVLIDTGHGKGKLTEKQKRNLGMVSESNVEESLGELGLVPEDIDLIIMTHLHNDHAAGLTKRIGEQTVSFFPNAKIYVSAIEWDEMRHPNIRSRNAYFRENWEPIQQQVKTFDGQIEVLPGIALIHTGGHSEGHSIVKLTQDGDTILHMADIMPTHAHSNPLWVLAFDDYPMTSIYAKERLMKEALPAGYKFIFYHDAVYRLVQWDESGKEIVEALECSV